MNAVSVPFQILYFAAGWHLSSVQQTLPLLGPAGSSLSQGQAGICKLEGQLSHLKTSLMQFGLAVIPLADHCAQITLQSFCSTLARVQTFPQAAHLLQRCLVLRLAIKKERACAGTMSISSGSFVHHDNFE